MGRTSKACPGCKRTETWKFRDADGVCDTCASKLRMANDFLERQKRGRLEGEPTRFLVPDYYSDLRVPLPIGCHWGTWNEQREAAEGWAKAYLRLVELVAAPLMLEQLGLHSTKDCPFLFTHLREYHRQHPGSGRLGRPAEVAEEMAQVLDELYQRTGAVLQGAFEDGKKQGGNILMQLNTGGITLDQFNDAVVEKEKKGR